MPFTYRTTTNLTITGRDASNRVSEVQKSDLVLSEYEVAHRLEDHLVPFTHSRAGLHHEQLVIHLSDTLSPVMVMSMLEQCQPINVTDPFVPSPLRQGAPTFLRLFAHWTDSRFNRRAVVDSLNLSHDDILGFLTAHQVPFTSDIVDQALVIHLEEPYSTALVTAALLAHANTLQG